MTDEDCRLYPLFYELLLSSYIPNTIPPPEKPKVSPSPKPTQSLASLLTLSVGDIMSEWAFSFFLQHGSPTSRDLSGGPPEHYNSHQTAGKWLKKLLLDQNRFKLLGILKWTNYGDDFISKSYHRLQNKTSSQKKKKRKTRKKRTNPKPKKILTKPKTSWGLVNRKTSLLGWSMSES